MLGKRIDKADVKRVELHCHTKRSDGDGIAEVKDILRKAYSWGHKAIAITDHGVLSAFPEAFETVKEIWEEDNNNSDNKFKVIYGIEAYLVDDLKEIAISAHDYTLSDDFVAIDMETTGFSPKNDKIIEIVAIKVKKGKVVSTYHSYVNPEIVLTDEMEEFFGIKNEKLQNERNITQVLPEFLGFCGEDILVGYNMDFDVAFIKENLKYLNLEYSIKYIDVLKIAVMVLPDLKSSNLKVIMEELCIEVDKTKGSVCLMDAEIVFKIYIKLLSLLISKNICTTKQLNSYTKHNVEYIHKMPTTHITILAKNLNGLRDLCHLVELSHNDYFHRVPRIPKSVLAEHRSELVIGSGCVSGELYKALLKGVAEEDIEKIAQFYDYYEVQPTCCNEFLIWERRYSQISTLDDIKSINKNIVQLGEKFNTPVLATGEVHYINPEDATIRKKKKLDKGYAEFEYEDELYYRTTEEMLSEFEYLGIDIAKKVVIDNTNFIENKIEIIDDGEIFNLSIFKQN